MACVHVCTRENSEKMMGDEPEMRRQEDHKGSRWRRSESHSQMSSGEPGVALRLTERYFGSRVAFMPRPHRSTWRRPLT